MRSRIIFAVTALALLVCALGFSAAGSQTPVVRYHQHLEQPGEEQLGPCASCDGTALCTHLPVLRIDTGGQKIPGAAILDGTYQITGYETGDHGEAQILTSVETVEGEGVYHHGNDAATLSARAYLRYRGDTSRAFSKHSYLIKLVESDDPLQNRDLPLLGMEADNEWALHGPFLDKTLLRNYMWMNLSAEVMGSAPDVRFCELLVDGEYQGVYVLMETNTRGDGRVRLTEYTPGDPVCSYLVRIGTNTNPLKTVEPFSFYTARLEAGSCVEVLYPTALEQTEAVHDYVTADLSGIERLLFSADRDEWEDVIDRASFVDYYILQEFLAVNDAFTKSTYLYRDVRGKLHAGPVWDYNNVLDNFFRPIEAEGFLLSRRGYFAPLMTDPDFVEAVIRRYRELRQGVLSEEYLNTYINETAAWLGGAVDRNYSVWGYTFDTENGRLSQAEYRQPALNDVARVIADHGYGTEATSRWLMDEVRRLNPADHEQSMEWMRDYMNRRGRWLDRHIETLRQHCASSKTSSHQTD